MNELTFSHPRTTTTNPLLPQNNRHRAARRNDGRNRWQPVVLLGRITSTHIVGNSPGISVRRPAANGPCSPATSARILPHHRSETWPPWRVHLQREQLAATVCPATRTKLALLAEARKIVWSTRRAPGRLRLLDGRRQGLSAVLPKCFPPKAAQ